MRLKTVGKATFCPKPAATIEVLAKAIKELKNSDVKLQSIGTRHGEKLYEVLVTKEEMLCAEDKGDYFRIPADSRILIISSSKT